MTSDASNDIQKVHPEIYADSDDDSGCLGCIPALKSNNERQGFVRKVYALLFIQLMITCLFVGAGVGFKEVRDFMNKDFWLYIITAVICGIIMIMLICTYDFFKEVPYNYILLFVFVICESYTVAIITSYYTPMSVLIAACMTLAMTFTLSLSACFHTSAFTIC